MRIFATSLQNHIITRHLQPNFKSEQGHFLTNPTIKSDSRSPVKNTATVPEKRDIYPSCSFVKGGNFTSVPDIEHEEFIFEYKDNPAKLKRMRWKYANYEKLISNPSNMPDKEHIRLPLQSEKEMDDFIETSRIYCKYKDQPIICLGRSPKWFLNTALWMKDGIPDYKFVAFSGYWYRPDPIEGIVPLKNNPLRDDVLEEHYKIFSKTDVDSNAEDYIIKEQLGLSAGKNVDDRMVTLYKEYKYRIDSDLHADKKEVLRYLLTPLANLPTDQEIKKYQKYLNRIKADPLSIVENMKQTGKKTVITDYVCTGKGFSSFLDVMGNYANRLGILEDFSKSIEIVALGSYDYMEHLNPYAEEFSIPEVIMPPILSKYGKNIKQTFYNIENYDVFKGMLINQNTNECRSTYYPHWAWNIYDPDRYKTGIIRDFKKLAGIKKLMPYSSKSCLYSFAPEMRDYRNLLNFRILDGLNTRGLLKVAHKTKL